MNKLKSHYYTLPVFLILALTSCKQSDNFIEPSAKMTVVSNNISLLDKLEIRNLGKGQKFVFWTGDAGHNYNLRSNGGNYGLAPNAGNDLVYYYIKAGEYTVYMIASSYDSENDKFVQKIDSAKITVSGTAVNNFTSFAIKNAWIGYSPMGVIKNDSVFIKIAPVNRPLYVDSLLAYIVNMKPPVFTVAENLDNVTVYDENGVTYKGNGTDVSQLNLFKINGANDIESLTRTFTIVDNATQNAHAYKVAAMLYPEMYSFNIGGDTALMFSQDGLAQLSKNDIIKFCQAHADSTYLGIFLDEGQDVTNVTPEFTVSPNSVVTLNGVEQISGVSKVNLSAQPVVYRITKIFGSFSISTKVTVIYNVF